MWEKIKNKVLALLVLILVCMSIFFSYEYNHYKNEYEVANQHAITLQANLNTANNTISATKDQAEKTSAISVKRQQDRTQITTVNNKTQEQLNAAIKTNPDWSTVRVPDGVFQSLKTD